MWVGGCCGWVMKSMGLYTFSCPVNNLQSVLCPHLFAGGNQMAFFLSLHLLIFHMCLLFVDLNCMMTLCSGGCGGAFWMHFASRCSASRVPPKAARPQNAHTSILVIRPALHKPYSSRIAEANSHLLHSVIPDEDCSPPHTCGKHPTFLWHHGHGYGAL